MATQILNLFLHCVHDCRKLLPAELVCWRGSNKLQKGTREDRRTHPTFREIERSHRCLTDDSQVQTNAQAEADVWLFGDEMSGIPREPPMQEALSNLYIFLHLAEHPDPHLQMGGPVKKDDHDYQDC
jgi:hypothetical protein